MGKSWGMVYKATHNGPLQIQKEEIDIVDLWSYNDIKHKIE